MIFRLGICRTTPLPLALLPLALMWGGLIVLCSHPAQALVSLTSAQAEGAPATLDSVSVPGSDAASSFGFAPPAFSQSNTLASFNSLGVLTLGTVTTSASSDADGTPGSKTTSASATIAGATFLDRFVVGAVTDSVSVFGDYGAFSSSAAVSIASLTIDGIAYDTANPAPNTVIYNQGGTIVTLNEQTISTFGPGDLARFETAVDIQVFNATSASGLLLGNLFAIEVADIPEPATFTLFAIPMLGLTLLRRQRLQPQR